jgi:Zn-dependent peptidase ImmA (M78 family)
MIAQRVEEFRRQCQIPVDPARRGPVPLDRFFEECDVAHVALRGLTSATIHAYLQAEGIRADALMTSPEPLAGFLFHAGRSKAFINADDILPRRRFTAAHELGHAVLHIGTMSSFQPDTQAALFEADEPKDPIEREANQFAAELLMPEEIVRAREAELVRQYGCCPRSVLTYRLAAELLVSREAMRNRIRSLGVGDDD